MANTTAMFHCFSSLPPELQHQIWAFALAQYIKPAMVVYEEGFRRLLEISPHAGGENICQFRGNPFNPGHLRFPLAHVNHETRRMTFDWMHRENKLVNDDLTAQDAKQLSVYSFTPTEDVLFVPTDFWNILVQDPRPIACSDDTRNVPINGWPAKIQRLALREKTLFPEEEVILDLWLWKAIGTLLERFPALKELIIIFGEVPVSHHMDRDTNIHPESWELMENASEGNKAIQYLKNWLVEHACWFGDDKNLKHVVIRGAHVARELHKQVP